MLSLKNASCIKRSTYFVWWSGMGIFNSIHIGSVGICSTETHERLLLLVQVSYDVLVQLPWRFVDLVSTSIYDGIAIVA
jgi:hypothetical protein